MPSRGGTMTGLTGQFGDADVSAVRVLDHSMDDSLDLEMPSGAANGIEETSEGVVAAAVPLSTPQRRIAQLRQEQQELRVKLVMTEADTERQELSERLRHVTEEIDQISK